MYIFHPTITTGCAILDSKTKEPSYCTLCFSWLTSREPSNQESCPWKYTKITSVSESTALDILLQQKKSITQDLHSYTSPFYCDQCFLYTILNAIFSNTLEGDGKVCFFFYQVVKNIDTYGKKVCNWENAFILLPVGKSEEHFLDEWLFGMPQS